MLCTLSRVPSLPCFRPSASMAFSWGYSNLFDFSVAFDINNFLLKGCLHFSWFSCLRPFVPGPSGLPKSLTHCSWACEWPHPNSSGLMTLLKIKRSQSTPEAPSPRSLLLQLSSFTLLSLFPAGLCLTFSLPVFVNPVCNINIALNRIKTVPLFYCFPFVGHKDCFNFSLFLNAAVSIFIQQALSQHRPPTPSNFHVNCFAKMEWPDQIKNKASIGYDHIDVKKLLKLLLLLVLKRI